MQIEAERLRVVDTPMFPIMRCSEKDALHSYESLVNFDFTPTIVESKWESRLTVIDEEYVRDLLLKRTTTGNDASNYFHFSARMACEHHAHASPIRSWFDTKLRKNIESSAFFKTDHRSALAMRGYIAAQFRPSAAKAFMTALDSKKVYDPCGGWGDRLAGAMASNTVEYYYCRDVNPLVFSGYAMQKLMYGKVRQMSFLDPITEVDFELKGSEIDCPAEDFFDLVFTSPPYFKTEKYEGKASSWKQYEEFETWLSEFLFKMLTHAFASLKDGGVMAINISDCKTNNKLNKICMPAIEYCKLNLKDCEVLGVMGYELAPRVGANIDAQKTTNAEPVLVFRKNVSKRHNKTLEELILKNKQHA